MKKALIILILLSVSVLSYSESFDFGDFPLGKWLDPNWDAIWEFRSDNIRILDTDGGVYYDFEGKTINDFKVMPSSKGLELSFECEETEKKYMFIKPLTNMNLKMIIDKKSGEHYEVELPYQK